MTDEQKRNIAAWLNAFPEVRWDRLTNDADDEVKVYGWIDRPDGRADFLLLDFPDLDMEPIPTTSSPELSAEIARRFYDEQAGAVISHIECERVEDVLGDLIPNKIRLTSTVG